MAFKRASGLIKWTVDKLSGLLQPQVGITSGESSKSALEEDIKHLERTMKRIQSVILDVPKVGILDQSQKHRLEELRDVAYNAEDLVEEYKYEVLDARVQARNKMVEHVTADLSSINVSIQVPEEISMRAKGIRERFDEIVGEWEKLRLSENDGEKRCSHNTITHPPTSSLVYEPDIHGRHQDKENVIEVFLKENSDVLHVLPVVGMGGVGKTTLAQLVYNDPRINSHFDLKVWVYVSKEFDVQALTQVIITSLTKKPCETMQLDDLQRILKEKIKEKRFLLVLDDVWNERPSLWYLLRAPFDCSHSSSCRILVTTRNEKVAKIMQTIPYYPLTCLGQEDSWQLFRQVAFHNQDLGGQADLLEIGRKITTKCGGLPLAIRAVGCALRFEPRKEFWRNFLESDLWELEVGMNEVLPALRLSYDCMPENLKECFMSFSLFPKNCVFFKENTVKFWSYLGFLQLENRRFAENVGYQYFDDMQQRSLLQIIKYDEKKCFFFMHDLVRKLAEFVARPSFRKLKAEALNLSCNRSRYLSVLVHELPTSVDLSSIQLSSSLRALQIFNTVNPWLGKGISIKMNEGLFQDLRSLRVLNFSNSGISTLPYSIGNLRQLRFLGLANTKITTLPESIGLLYNLQTLDLLGCHLQVLPNGIKNLVNLQHLIVEKWSNICLPCGIRYLTNLETLPVFNIGINSGCELSEMRNLRKLRGDLRITGLDSVWHVQDVVLADLSSKQHIQALMLDWSHGASESANHSSVVVSDLDHGLLFEALRPPLNLQVLEMYHYPGLRYPKWLGDPSYFRLVKIVLFGNRKMSCEFLPPLGQLPSLRDLSIQFMLTVEYVGGEFCLRVGQNRAFQSLITLEFKYMPKWIQWFGVRCGDFCSLKTLKIVSCNALRSLPDFLSPSLEKLVLVHCSELACVPTMLTSLTSLILLGDINKSLLANMNLHLLKSLQIGFSKTMQYVMLHLMPLLEVLVVKGCRNIKSLYGLTDLVFLKELELDECPSLVLSSDESIPTCLKILKVTNCPCLCYWEINQMKKIENKPARRDTGTNNDLQAFEDAGKLHCEEPNNSTKDNSSTKSGETFNFSTIKNDELQPVFPTTGDDYDLNWLLSVIQKSQEYIKGEQTPTPSRKRFWNGSIKGPPYGSDKGKQICEYSSGSSIAGTSISELGSFGGTSEEDWS